MTVDEIDELFGRGNPNPDRVGCLPPDVLAKLARRDLPISDPGYRHLADCSPCYVAVRRLQESAAAARRTTRRRWAGSLVSVAAVSVLAAWMYLRDSPAAPSHVRIDLRPYDVTRGTPSVAEPPPIILPRANLELTLVLPAGSEPGTYQVRILNSDDAARATGTGSASMRDSATVLETTLDLRSVGAGSYRLETGRDSDERHTFDVRVQ